MDLGYSNVDIGEKLKIPILKIPYNTHDHEFINTGITQILDSGQQVMGDFTRQFEEGFGKFSNASYCLATSSGTASLELILRALDIHGRSVIVPTNTFMATAFAVVNTSNRVILADSDPRTLCLDPKDVMRRVESDTAAVIWVHIGGVMSPAIRDMREFCRKKGIFLIEDCAHAHGCRLGDESAGTIGIAGAFSFFPTKVFTTGEGGAVLTTDAALDKKIRVIRNHGKNPDQGNAITAWGDNFRMSEFTALLGVQQMKKADWILTERRRAAKVYDEAFGDDTLLKPVRLSPECFSTYYKYICHLDAGIDRDVFKTRLRERYGVSLTGEVYAKLCHEEPVWKNQSSHMPKDFPGALNVSRHHVCLPLYPGLTHDELLFVVDSVKGALKELSSKAMEGSVR
jgi:perosamine synthetase